MTIERKQVKIFMSFLQFQEESKTRDAFTEDGVLWKSGDLGVLDWEGHLRITGNETISFC